MVRCQPRRWRTCSRSSEPVLGSDAHVELVPLDGDVGADASRRHGVVGALDLDVAVEVHGALAEAVVAEWLDG